MNKTYYYKPKFFRYKVTYIGIFAIFFLLYSIYNLFVNQNIIYSLPIIICAYIIMEDFVTISNPSSVTITDESITFSAYGRSHKFLWNEMRSFTIKEFISSRKMFIRINGGGIFSGRYWLSCLYFLDGEELYMWLRDKEYLMNPNSLKSQARRSNEKDFAQRQVKNAEKQAAREKKQQERLERLGIKRKNTDK